MAYHLPFTLDTPEWEERVFNISVNVALKTREKDAETVIEKELNQMISKKVWTPVNISALTRAERGQIIRSNMFLARRVCEKMKARLVATGDSI